MKKKLAIIAGALFLAAGAVNFAYSQTQKKTKLDAECAVKKYCGKKGSDETGCYADNLGASCKVANDCSK
ncbi:hypothetical protein BN938_2186 [Mucinivorans hirudinis]|uniref:Uncharacterized protein n=1 Tax=Mucinivorans hirudinis TaxID=1433126 RepID=A0A060RE03_9BACT|nr:hypothetical protein BN938_2186 [Mucinivorans hirudinis]